MTDFYVDSSALLKRHVRENGTDWIRTIVEPTTGNVIMTARLSAVEIFSALNRRRREANINTQTYLQLASEVVLIFATEYRLVELTPDIVDRARELLERHPLRAYDAVQLAAALIANATLITASLRPLTFLSADDRLLQAAQVEGLATDNPNAHP